MDSVDTAKPQHGRVGATAYFYVVVALAVLFTPLFFLRPLRVGDGSEYYALFLAIRNEAHTWVTALTFRMYEGLIASNSIQALIPVDVLRDSFPALRLGSTADFNHFWVYSLISALLSKALSLVGIHVDIHQSFLVQHFLLFLGTAWVALHALGRRGVFAVLALTLSAPIVWFADKVHTEFFTYCLVLSCVILVQRRSFTWGALCLALASTQNPSFAVLALLLLIYRAFQLRERDFDFLELCALVGTCLVVFLHPAYYYFRFGILTPQMLAGGAKIGANLSLFYVWMIDPDVGLLPNWPMGLFLLAAGVVALKLSAWKKNKALLFFIFAYFVVNLFAQSSTTNINSGATPGLARYALWYIPLFFPLMYALIVKLETGGFILRTAMTGLVAIYLVVNVWVYEPQQGERYESPSPVSMFVQKHLPWLYDPPPEVFAERFSGSGEATQSAPFAAIVGPSCEKILVVPESKSNAIFQTGNCLLDDQKLRPLIQKLASGRSSSYYAHFDPSADDVHLSASRTYDIRAGSSGLGMLAEGWNSPEEWGAWSASMSSKLNVPCPSVPNFKIGLTITSLEVAGEAPQSLKIIANGKTLWAGELRSVPQDAILALNNADCANHRSVVLSLEAGRLYTPSKFSNSGDTRKLGVGLRRVFYPDL